MQLSALIIRIDSPVDVVLTDAIGRRVGVVDGQEINEFGSQAHDTGAETHPRLYIIQYPQAGNYTLRSIGTGTGPFTVHVYSVDSEKKVTEHISHTGEAEPGSAATHDFDLNETAHVAFANAAPMADAGFDQTADADASGNATFALDGSLSSDPDGDTLTFTWAGPFGILSGAQVSATLPVGVHVIKLTVDDGNGGSAEGTVQLTVNAVSPPPDTTAPVLTLPDNIVVQASSSGEAVVTFSATANDDVDGSVPVICVPASGATFAVGTTTVNCSATDLSNNSANGSFSVTVNPAPSAAPTCSAAPTMMTLAPPFNPNVFVPIALSGANDPDGDPLTYAATSIFQDEKLTDAFDAILSPVQVRKWRSANPGLPGSQQTGRVYYIGYTATDPGGLFCTGEVQVCLPRVGGACVAEGKLFNSAP